MEGQTTRYAVLRDGAQWEGVTTTGLEPEASGALVLARDAAEGSSVEAEDAPPFVAEGWLEVGPRALDAGEQSAWERVFVEAEVPEDTRVELEIFAHDEPTVADEEMLWKRLPTLDALVSAAGEWRGLRYLWLRVRLRSEQGDASPRLLQVKAATAGESYLDYLPAFYRRDAETRDFLARWLGLFRAELGDLETTLEEMPRGFEPARAREEYLPWLAGWLAFELPHGRGAEAARSLLRRASRLYERRGTPAGIAEFIELYTGVRPRIVEEFAERKIWQLDVTSTLGEDTVLPSSTLGGFVVPDAAAHPAVGAVVVGESGPLPRDEFGETLFSEAAHRFRVVVPADGMDDALRRAVAQIIEAEKPAHTEYKLCVESEEEEAQEAHQEVHQEEPTSVRHDSNSASAPQTETETDGAEASDAPEPSTKSDESAVSVEEQGEASQTRADAGLRVESIEFLDARNRVVGTLGGGAGEEARFKVEQQLNGIRVRFNRPVDVSSVVTGVKRENPARFTFLLQANWSRRAERYVPGTIFLDSKDPRAVRFVPVTAHGSLRTGRYAVTLFGAEGDELARLPIRDMDGQALRVGENDEGGNVVFRFQIDA